MSSDFAIEDSANAAIVAAAGEPQQLPPPSSRSPPPFAPADSSGDRDEPAGGVSLRLAAADPLPLDVPRITSAASDLNSSISTPHANTPVAQRYHGGSAAAAAAGPLNHRSNSFLRRSSSGALAGGAGSRQSTEESLCGLEGSPTSVVSAGSATFVVGAFRVSYCPICFEGFSLDNPAMVLACGHVFHVQCHMAWRQRSAACAVCQATVEDSAARLMTVSDVQSRRKQPLPAQAFSPAAAAAASNFTRAALQTDGVTTGATAAAVAPPPRPMLRDADEIQMDAAVRSAPLRAGSSSGSNTNRTGVPTPASLASGSLQSPPITTREPGAPLAPHAAAAAGATAAAAVAGGRRGHSPSRVQYVAVVHAIDDDDDAAATQGPCPRGAAASFLGGSASTYGGGRRVGGGEAKTCGVLGSLQRFFSCFTVPKPSQQAHQRRAAARYGNAAHQPSHHQHHHQQQQRSAVGSRDGTHPAASGDLSGNSAATESTRRSGPASTPNGNGSGSAAGNGGVSIASTASLSSNGREMGFVGAAAPFHEEEERMAQQKAVRTSP